MTVTETLNALHGAGLTLAERAVPLITDEPKIPQFLCSSATAEGITGQGIHPDEDMARLKAVAECLERLCLSHPECEPTEPMVYSSVAGGVDPAMFLTGREQVVSKAREGRYRWWPVDDLASGKRRAIPAQMVQLSHFDEEFPLRREHLSTGGALGAVGSERALTAGLFELAERDACVASYLKQLELARFVELPEMVLDLTGYLWRYRLETHLFRITTDLGVPTALALTIDRSGLGPAVNVGSCAAASYEDALAGALLESIQARRGIRLAPLPERFPKEDEVTSLENRFYFWHPVERIERLRFWLDSEKTVSFEELAGVRVTAAETIARLLERGYHVFVAEMTLPQVREKGFEVLKVVVPELHPMYLDERAKALYSVHHGEIEDDPALAPHPMV